MCTNTHPGGRVSGTTTSLAVIGDVHAMFDRLNRVLEWIERQPVHGVLLVGDVSTDPPWSMIGQPEGRAAQIESFSRVLDAVRRLGLPLAFVPGNHDPPDLPLEGNVDGRAARIAGLEIAGIGGAGPHRFGFPYEWDEDDIRDRNVPACEVLLCHTPPAGTPLARLARGGDAGSEAIRERALRHRGALVCGHIHESAGACVLGDCLCFNVGALGEPYGRACVGRLDRHDHDGVTTWAAQVVELDRGDESEVWRHTLSAAS